VVCLFGALLLLLCHRGVHGSHVSPPNVGTCACAWCSPLGWNNQPGASGPWPHSRYLTRGFSKFTINVTALLGGEGSSIQAADSLGIINDNLVGGVTQGGDFCLDLVGGAGCARTVALPYSTTPARWAVFALR
jgi:hypothetical protein